MSDGFFVLMMLGEGIVVVADSLIAASSRWLIKVRERERESESQACPFHLISFCLFLPASR